MTMELNHITRELLERWRDIPSGLRTNDKYIIRYVDAYLHDLCKEGSELREAMREHLIKALQEDNVLRELGDSNRS